jgi:ribonuclease HI
MSDTPLEQLQQLAYKSERAQAVRLAQHLQLDPASALTQVLTQVAGVAGLAQLLAQRAAVHLREVQRQQARAATLAQRQATRQAQGVALSEQGWQGWFDGSALPNPGRLGIGALLRGPQGQIIQISQAAGYGNSSEAEYLALTALLEAALQAGVRELHIRGDSQVVVNDVNLPEAAITAGQGASALASHRAQVHALMAQLSTVHLRWLPRHRNAAADQLAQQALKSAPPGEDQQGIAKNSEK